LLLVRGFRFLAFLFECSFEAVEACLPELSVLFQPLVELAERLGFEE